MVQIGRRDGTQTALQLSVLPARSIFTGTRLFYCVYWSCALRGPRGSFLGVVPHILCPKWPPAKWSNWTKMFGVINLCLLGRNCCDSLRGKMGERLVELLWFPPCVEKVFKVTCWRVHVLKSCHLESCSVKGCKILNNSLSFWDQFVSMVRLFHIWLLLHRMSK